MDRRELIKSAMAAPIAMWGVHEKTEEAEEIISWSHPLAPARVYLDGVEQPYCERCVAGTHGWVECFLLRYGKPYLVGDEVARDVRRHGFVKVESF